MIPKRDKDPSNPQAGQPGAHAAPLLLGAAPLPAAQSQADTVPEVGGLAQELAALRQQVVGLTNRYQKAAASDTAAERPGATSGSHVAPESSAAAKPHLQPAHSGCGPTPWMPCLAPTVVHAGPEPEAAADQKKVRAALDAPGQTDPGTPGASTTKRRNQPLHLKQTN
jgi:hypothetical protein